MGQPTFDLCYSENFPRDAQSNGNVMLARQVLANTSRSDVRSECDAELMRGAPAAGWLFKNQKQHVFGLTEITKKVFIPEYIGNKSKPRELKHLSTWRKGHQRDSVSSGERTRTRPVLCIFEPERLGTVGLSG